MTDFANMVEGCAEYIGILNGQPNGLGQNVGRHGPSHNTLRLLTRQFGETEVNLELKRQFAESAQRARCSAVSGSTTTDTKEPEDAIA